MRGRLVPAPLAELGVLDGQLEIALEELAI